MNNALLLSLVLFCCGLQMQAQTLTEAEVTAKMNEAFVLNNAKKTAEALDAFLLVGRNTEQQRNEVEHQVYVCSQTMACMCYETLGRYKEGYLLAKQLLKRKLTNLEKKDIDYWFVLNGYMYAGNLLDHSIAKYAEARKIFKEILFCANERFSAYIEPKIPLTWYFEGAFYQSKHDYGNAFPCMETAYKEYYKIKDYPNAISALRNMAAMKMHLYETNEAISFFEKAKELANQSNEMSTLMSIYNDLYQLYFKLGDMSKQEEISLRMDSLINNTTDTKLIIEYNTYKGDDAINNGEYEVAELWYKKNVELLQTHTYIKLDGYPYTSYLKLRELYNLMNKPQEALKFAELCKKTFQNHTLKNDANYYMPYRAIAYSYRQMKDSDNCKKALDSLFFSLNMIQEPREKQQLYIVRGLCHSTFGEYNKALLDYQEADTILSTKYSKADGDRIRLLPLMAGMEHKLENYEKSKILYEQYATALKKKYGEDNLEYIQALGHLANAYGFAGNIVNGERLYVSAVEKIKEFMKQRMGYLTPLERKGLWSKVSDLFVNMAPFAIKAKEYESQFTRSCYDALILSKSFLLDSERSTYEFIKATKDKELLHEYTVLSSMQMQLKEMEKDYNLYADSIMSVTAQLSIRNKNIFAKYRKYGFLTTFMDIDYLSVKSNLCKNEFLVDFTDFVSDSEGRRYAAFIINKEHEYPHLIPLFAEKQISSLGITRPDLFYDTDYSEEVIQLIWQPLKNHIPKGSTIYYVPSQVLFQVSLESLPLADGTLLGNHYNFVRLSSARELVKMKSKSNSNKANTAVLYGGLQYDLETSAMAEESKKYDLSNLLALRGEIARGDSVFHDLQGTKEEILKIEDLLKRNKWQVSSYMGKNGTEESFLNMHGKSPKLLHLATHGFYYTPNRAENVDYLKGYTDAMSLSGLVLSGGNAAWLGKPLPKGVLGGILSANDIARLDLSNTDMVVLSACQTGQGKATSEGLYGLQRAFKKAGVGTIVMSLWSVSDKITSEFMTTFYERLADTHNAWNKRKAFEESKEIIRKKHPDPFHWAAFVMLD